MISSTPVTTISVLFRLPQWDYSYHLMKRRQIVYWHTTITSILLFFPITMITSNIIQSFLTYYIYLFPVFSYWTISLTWGSVICPLWSLMYPLGLEHCLAHKLSINIYGINLANQRHCAPQRGRNLTGSLRFFLHESFTDKLILPCKDCILSSPWILGNLVICFLFTILNWQYFGLW